MPSRRLKPRTATELEELADVLAASARKLRKVSRRIKPFGITLAILHEGGIFGEWKGKLGAFVQDAERKADAAGV